MNKSLPEERVDMLLEEWGKEEDEDTPTATCRCLSHTPGESPSDMIADIVAATTEFIPSSSSGMNLRNLEMEKIEEVMNVDESLNFYIRTPPDVEIPLISAVKGKYGTSIAFTWREALPKVLSRNAQNRFCKNAFFAQNS